MRVLVSLFLIGAAAFAEDRADLAAIQRIKTEAEVKALKESEEAASAYANNPALLRLRELETLRELARNANARIYIGFDKHAPPTDDETNGSKA